MPRLNALSLSISLLIAAASAAAQPPQDKSKVAALADKLQARAEQYLSVESDDAGAEDLVGSVRYGDDDLKDLSEALRRSYPNDADAYVINGLLQPLMAVDGDKIAQYMPLIMTAQGRAGRFRELPRIPPAAMRQFQIPDYNPRTPPATLLVQIEQAQQRRAQKLRKDEQILRHNRAIHNLQKTIVQLMVQTGQPRYVIEIARAISTEEARRNRGFIGLLDAAAKAAETAPKPMAEMIYRNFAETARGVRLLGRDYINPFEMKMEEDASTELTKGKAYVGLEYIRAANRIARKHGLSTIDEPDKKELEEAAKRRGR